MQQISFMTKAMQVTSKVEIQQSPAKAFLSNTVPFKHLLSFLLTALQLSTIFLHAILKHTRMLFQFYVRTY
jgi:hypothetical protein